ncbi:hypothetical protein KIN20_006437 [Parelaphostrongylus tenuis]|uniref:Uncharacterized protein n=1 Tax=Parelaphostrongylus tenuis TaxID=148309 RepID=A0AAD5MU44_PARTN|nr:hypothetical protein KIN20_006437 [Parelaphostrongylus tenuis]
MDEEVSNGASETNTSSTTVLSRKGLFGKSGLVNDTFDTSIAVEKDPIVSSRETPNRDNEEESRTDVSASNSNDAEVPSHGNEVLERQSEQSADEEVAGEAHGTDVPSVKESGDFASKEHEKSNIELDARDQHLDNKVPEKDPIVNSEETHHQDNDDSKNDDSMQGNPHSDITSPRSPNDSLSPRSPQNVPSSGPPCNVSSPGSPHDKPSPGSPHDKPSSGSPHDKPSPGSPHDTPSPGHNGKDVPTTVEEICVKKIISMDTDDTEKEQIGGASPSSDVEVQVKDDDVRDTTAITENTTEDETNGRQSAR